MTEPRALSQLLNTGGDRDIALVSAGSSTSYAELRTQVRNAAAALHHCGLRRGDRALIVLPNDSPFAVCNFAVWTAGGVVVPMDYRSPAEQIVRIARDCQASTIICDGLVFARVESRLREIPSLRFALVKDLRPRTYRLQIEVAEYGDVTAFDGPAPEIDTEPQELAALTYTSGSTGSPKGVMHSHESLISSLCFTRDHLGIDPGDRVLISFPMYHLFSLRVLLVHLMVGAAVITAPDILAGLKRIQDTRPNALILVPAACKLLMDRFASALAQCGPLLRRMNIGSAALSPALFDRLQELLPETALHIPYGMTEARIGFLEAVPGRSERRLLASDPNLELRVLDDEGKEVEEGVGELVLRGPALMLGYWHNRDTENRAIRRDGFRTRDLMERDAEGNLFLVGRRDEVISVGGEKVFPNEVEAALLAHPRIWDARVVGEEDPRGVRGQVVHASVVLDPDAEIDDREILAHCRARLEPFKLPAIVERVAEIVRNDMGKVAKLPRARSPASGGPR